MVDDEGWVQDPRACGLGTRINDGSGLGRPINVGSSSLDLDQAHFSPAGGEPIWCIAKQMEIDLQQEEDRTDTEQNRQANER